MEYIGLPNAEACRLILSSTVAAFAEAFPQAKKIIEDQALAEAAALCVGLDGRQIRKLIPAACALEKSVAMRPDTLTARHIVRAASNAQRGLKALKEAQ